MWKFAVVWSAVAFGLWDVAPARAVIIIGGSGVDNTVAPTGGLAGSGWDLQGTYGAYLGTPIAADWFVTAAHFGPVDTQLTTTDGVSHPVTATVPIVGTDLVLRQVSVPFANYASIYNPLTDGTLGTSDALVVFGRGTAKGAAITSGWAWGDDTHVKTYGTNTFDGTVAITQSDIDAGSNLAIGTTFLTADFDNNGSATEGTLSNGDSGGGVFVFKNGGWKLVGINYGVDLYSATPTGPDLGAALYDTRGYYQKQADGTYAFISNDPAINPVALPQSWYASYVPDSLAIISATVPEPGSLAVLGIGAVIGLRRRRV